MKNLIYTTAKTSDNGFSPFFFLKGTSNKSYENNNDVQAKTSHNYGTSRLLTPEASLGMSNGSLPNLATVCRELFNTFHTKQAPYSALQFVPVMQKVSALDPDQLKRFLKNRETRYVLVDNSWMKVVLIHWKPGKVSDIHGHPSGGCVFKVLHGKLEELRYSTDEKQRILCSNGYRTGSIAYIDDRLGYHAVGNPFGASAVSLHVYTPGSPKSFNENIF
ncbi:cysteine dioxygenase [Maribellus sediminis]|uniref:cysteine dioxygenase n=1 Tax=Maribellus sediminis TaxID=2696285 RepID=UPI001431B073|nr:cysteine dioxygenase family protein [Maribellus sediminis]